MYPCSLQPSTRVPGRSGGGNLEDDAMTCIGGRGGGGIGGRGGGGARSEAPLQMFGLGSPLGLGQLNVGVGAGGEDDLYREPSADDDSSDDNLYQRAGGQKRKRSCAEGHPKQKHGKDKEEKKGKRGE
jgi:hypothetical protein